MDRTYHIPQSDFRHKRTGHNQNEYTNDISAISAMNSNIYSSKKIPNAVNSFG